MDSATTGCNTNRPSRVFDRFSPFVSSWPGRNGEMFGHILLKRQKIAKNQPKNLCTPATGDALRRHSQYYDTAKDCGKIKRYSIGATVRNGKN